MKVKSIAIVSLAFAFLVPFAADADKKGLERGMLEKMETVPCGARQRGFTGLGSVWASVGITSVNSNEKLCPQYVLRTDELEYEIRPTDAKHPVVLPIGREGQFKVKKDRVYLMVETGSDRKMRAYQVVGVKQTNAESTAAQDSSASESHTQASPDVKEPDTKSSPAENNKTPGTDQTPDTTRPPAETTSK
jgi:hypothetical protein